MRPALVMTLLLSCVSASANGQDAKRLVRLTEAHLDTLAKKNGLSGAVLIAKDGRVLLRRAYGFANVIDRIPNTPDTEFNLASMGKMFTSVAIMQLVASGKVGLQEKVGKYLPNYPNRAVRDTVTVHQLLTHTAGLGNFWEEYGKVAKEKYKAVADYLPLFANQPLLFPPGTKLAYSNCGYMVLGLIIEAVSGQSYFEYVKEHVFAPAKMVHTDAYELDYPVANLATGYVRSEERPGQWMSNQYVNVVKGGPAGGSYSTLDDLLRFANALGDHRLLDEAATTELTSGKVKYRSGQYAYGFMEERVNGHRVIGHSGGHVGIADELLVFTDLGYTVVILTNGDVDNFWDIRSFIMKTLAGATRETDEYDFTQRALEATVRSGYEAGVAVLTDDPGHLGVRAGAIEQAGYKLLWQGKNDQAIAVFKLNLRAHPEASFVYLGLADAYNRAGDKNQAIEQYKKYLTMEPDDTAAKEKLKKLN